MDDLDAFYKRRAQWCRATGLRLSKAEYHWVFGGQYRYGFPKGFDHTGIYWLKRRGYVIITEPYTSRENAIKSVIAIGGMTYCEGPAGSGLWNPGRCLPLLIAKQGKSINLQRLAELLPRRLRLV